MNDFEVGCAYEVCDALVLKLAFCFVLFCFATLFFPSFHSSNSIFFVTQDDRIERQHIFKFNREHCKLEVHRKLKKQFTSVYPIVVSGSQVYIYI